MLSPHVKKTLFCVLFIAVQNLISNSYSVTCFGMSIDQSGAISTMKVDCSESPPLAFSHPGCTLSQTAVCSPPDVMFPLVSLSASCLFSIFPSNVVVIVMLCYYMKFCCSKCVIQFCSDLTYK